MTVVCLPNAHAVEMLGPLPDGVTAVVWDGGPDEPPRLAETEFWTPPADLPGKPHPEQIVARLPALRVIQVLSAGVDSMLSLVPEGVALCDGRGVHGSAVAEWVLAAILASVRDLPRYVHAQQGDHAWEHDGNTDELAGKRVLIVGAGDLGEQTARRLKGFDVEIVMSARSARDGVHAQDELPDLLPNADIVILLVPLTQETTGLVDARFLARLPDHALVVNAARGPVVDTDALLAELTSGRLRAAFDVTDPEPLPADHPLWTAPNFLLTPHVAGNVRGFSRRAYKLVREQIERYVAGEDLINVVIGDY